MGAVVVTGGCTVVLGVMVWWCGVVWRVGFGLAVWSGAGGTRWRAGGVTAGWVVAE